MQIALLYRLVLVKLTKCPLWNTSQSGNSICFGRCYFCTCTFLQLSIIQNL